MGFAARVSNPGPRTSRVGFSPRQDASRKRLGPPEDTHKVSLAPFSASLHGRLALWAECSGVGSFASARIAAEAVRRSLCPILCPPSIENSHKR
jgi:hypothetical protein